MTADNPSGTGDDGEIVALLNKTASHRVRNVLKEVKC